VYVLLAGHARCGGDKTSTGNRQRTHAATTVIHSTGPAIRLKVAELQGKNSMNALGSSTDSGVSSWVRFATVQKRLMPGAVMLGQEPSGNS